MSEDPAAPARSRGPARAFEGRGGAGPATRRGALRRGCSSLLLPARGLLFDNDGVLVDSEAGVVSAWSRWAEEHGLDPAEVVELVQGRRAADTVALLVAPERVAASVALVDRYELEDVAGTTAVPGVPDLVDQLSGVPWAVVTSGVKELATARLRAAGIPLPEAMVTAEDVAVGKPDPSCYLAGAAALDLPPESLLVLEDSVSGIAAGQAAGCRVVGVGQRALQTTVPVVVRDLTGARWTGDGLLLPAAALLRAP